MNKKSLFYLYAIAFMQGMLWSFVPFTSSFAGDKFTPQQFGTLSLLLILGAILFSFFMGNFSQFKKPRFFLTWGLLLSTFASGCFFYGLLFASPYLFFSIGMFLLGSAIGLLIPNLNLYLVHLVKVKKTTALTALYALVSLGACSTPFFFRILYPFSLHSSAPLALIFLIFIFCTPKTLKKLAPQHLAHLQFSSFIALWKKLPASFLFFVLAAFFYGIFETAYGTWGMLYLIKAKGFNPYHEAPFALMAFWGAATLGQILFSILFYFTSARPLYIFFPIFMLLASLFTTLAQNPIPSILLFFLAGLASSVYIPLTVRISSQKFPHSEASLFSVLYTCYFIGVGLCSYGIGFAESVFDAKLSFIFLLLPLAALLLVLVSFPILRSSKRNI